MRSRNAAIVALLTLSIAGGPVLLDRCLIACADAHPGTTSKALANAHCHETATRPTAIRWNSAPVCQHDHGAASAETTAQGRTESPLKILSTSAVHVGASGFAHPSRSVVPAFVLADYARETAAFAVPLRL